MEQAYVAVGRRENFYEAGLEMGVRMCKEEEVQVKERFWSRMSGGMDMEAVM